MLWCSSTFASCSTTAISQKKFFSPFCQRPRWDFCCTKLSKKSSLKTSGSCWEFFLRSAYFSFSSNPDSSALPREARRAKWGFADLPAFLFPDLPYLPKLPHLPFLPSLSPTPSSSVFSNPSPSSPASPDPVRSLSVCYFWATTEAKPRSFLLCFLFPQF